MPSTQLVTGALHVCCMCAACVLQAASLRIAEVDYSDEDSIAAAIPKGAKVVVVEGDVVGGRKTDAKVRRLSACLLPGCLGSNACCSSACRVQCSALCGPFLALFCTSVVYSAGRAPCCCQQHLPSCGPHTGATITHQVAI
jgi:hypothetical protein